ncbi:peroxiredoxin [Thermococcus barophilus]|uniref:Alkyl hydroperoxide reductase subunit C-like protein n=1 Tax=Thermococcus barophilus TaxID=55802 RepID=A0A0S1X9B7_THEBA|nr:peroxiredoxin [Thermococcus barophilus]ALM74375.1 Alkyl hydroperoxide reductase subunit C-like protein [Thermococcus barophilus]
MADSRILHPRPEGRDFRKVKVGDTAPDFSLKDQNGEEFKLSDYRGKKVLLSFHPLAWTSICAQQMRDLERNYRRFEELNVVPVGISVDSVPCKKAWADHLGLRKLRILSDFWPHGKVAKLYGVFRESNGFSERANIIVDEEGKIVFVKVYPIRELPGIEEILKFLEK